MRRGNLAVVGLTTALIVAGCASAPNSAKSPSASHSSRTAQSPAPTGRPAVAPGTTLWDVMVGKYEHSAISPTSGLLVAPNYGTGTTYNTNTTSQDALIDVTTGKTTATWTTNGKDENAGIAVNDKVVSVGPVVRDQFGSATDPDRVYCSDRNGKALGSVPDQLDTILTFSDGGSVVLASTQKQIIAIDPSACRVAWTSSIVGKLAGLYRGTLVFDLGEVDSNGPHSVVGLDPATGQQRWKLDGVETDTEPGSFAPDRLLVVVGNAGFRVVDPTTGAATPIPLHQGGVNSSTDVIFIEDTHTSAIVGYNAQGQEVFRYNATGHILGVTDKYVIVGKHKNQGIAFIDYHAKKVAFTVPADPDNSALAEANGVVVLPVNGESLSEGGSQSMSHLIGVAE